MKDGNFNKLITLVRHLADLEFTTTAGRVNILGMLLSVILAISLALAPLFETIVRLFHPGADVGAPLVQIFICFCIFVCICTFMIGYLEGPGGSRRSSKPSAKPTLAETEDKKKIERKVKKVTPSTVENQKAKANHSANDQRSGQRANMSRRSKRDRADK